MLTINDCLVLPPPPGDSRCLASYQVIRRTGSIVPFGPELARSPVAVLRLFKPIESSAKAEQAFAKDRTLAYARPQLNRSRVQSFFTGSSKLNQRNAP